ncbi:acyl-CoA/acyl-ACP dehydrogenase [Bradyrhizobium sp. INPA01-394B]|uniref:Acyl-CoA/acyl-ACP dehydrogenase n=1 Tax=Bradyrhizobium campsiandrae TaxID=1729892 RepID=A0ABR7UH14_9BRAD|nr:acyl-CoA dehydrogenase family protein [Bradyrhizobium campsiandrae]MBC9882286.1 acyl-CoA/acyl-ACP dehydrogenase [Bradyrhizobium campsiandrae]MBC9983178.1 acyl-CoA/acyl-ACP dehydrogenase [Bradyrhizobium campsiandrae]
MRPAFDEAEELSLLRGTMRRFVNDHMPRPEAARWDAESIFPVEVFRKLAALGVFGLSIPEEYGGAGRNIPATMIVIEELSRRGVAMSIPYVLAACYGGMNILECGNEDQKRALLPKCAAGELMLAFGVTEPDVGGDVASVKTTARRTGDVIKVNGTKRYITGANIADYIYTLVRSDDALPRYKNLSILLIPRTAKGVEIRKLDMLGLRSGAWTTEIIFDDVEVSVQNIVGGEAGWNEGWSYIAGPGLDVEKLEVGAIALGIAEAAVDDAWEYAETREQFGKPISNYQNIRHMLADARTDLHACRLMLYSAAGLAQAGRPCGIESSMAKLFICERAKQVVLNCQLIFGAYGCDLDLDMQRYVRDILILPIAGGSSAIQRNNLANRMRLRL